MTKNKTAIEVGIVIGYAALFALAIIGLYCNPDVLSVGMWRLQHVKRNI